jgi:hypothetical protein
MPTRLHRQRLRNWTMPPGAIYVGRPTRWGNPFPIITHPMLSDWTARRCAISNYESALWGRDGCQLLHKGQALTVKHVIEELAEATHLACWCSLALPCHVDVLLKVIAEYHVTQWRQGA